MFRVGVGEEYNNNQVIQLIMDVYRLALQVRCNPHERWPSKVWPWSVLDAPDHREELERPNLLVCVNVTVN